MDQRDNKPPVLFSQPMWGAFITNYRRPQWSTTLKYGHETWCHRSTESRCVERNLTRQVSIGVGTVSAGSHCDCAPRQKYSTGTQRIAHASPQSCVLSIHSQRWPVLPHCNLKLTVVEVESGQSLMQVTALTSNWIQKFVIKYEQRLREQ